MDGQHSLKASGADFFFPFHDKSSEKGISYAEISQGSYETIKISQRLESNCLFAMETSWQKRHPVLKCPVCPMLRISIALLVSVYFHLIANFPWHQPDTHWLLMHRHPHRVLLDGWSVDREVPVVSHSAPSHDLSCSSGQSASQSCALE